MMHALNMLYFFNWSNERNPGQMLQVGKHMQIDVQFLIAIACLFIDGLLWKYVAANYVVMSNPSKKLPSKLLDESPVFKDVH